MPISGRNWRCSKSRLVLNAALKLVDTAKLPGFAKLPDPIEWLEKQLQVDFAPGSEILRISMSGEKPDVPMLLVNAARNAGLLGRDGADVEMKQSRQRYDRLKATWNRYQENLREKRKQLKRLTELAGSDNEDHAGESFISMSWSVWGGPRTSLSRIQSEPDLARRS